MFRQARILAKTLPALPTPIGFLARVNSPMRNEIYFVTESLPTFQALIGFLPGVNSLVGREIDLLPETPATL